MRSSRGLTLIEVAVSLGVTAILLPVVGIVFYNLLVIPPEQSARLALNNEVSILSSWLYNDAHHAESFEVGEFPYYGNFTFIDYNEGREYVISYYYDPDRNSVARSVLRYGYVAPPTPTATPTSTPTPTPSPTAIPETQTYTFCNGSGEDRFAWAKAWNGSDWFDEGHPENSTDFFDEDTGAIVDADDYAYDLLCASDDQSWGSADIASGSAVNSQMYTFQVYQDRGNVSSLSVNWRGYGGEIDYGDFSTIPYSINTELQIWNYTTGEWTSLVSLSDPDSRDIDTHTRFPDPPEQYIQDGTGSVTLLASSDADEETPHDVDFGTGLYFNGSNSTMVTTSSTVPTNTFTFEAWVKATEIHEIDTELSQYGGTSGQRYVFGAAHRGSDAGVGLSVGTNGISVYEHGSNYMPAVAVYSGTLANTWNHIAVVYKDRTPSIYLNGQLVRTVDTAGIDALYSANRGTVYAPYQIGGGSYGHFTGWIDEVRVWDVALTGEQIRENMYREIADPSAEVHVFEEHVVVYTWLSQNIDMIYVEAKDITFPTGTDDAGTASLGNDYWISETLATWEIWKLVYDWAVHDDRGDDKYTFANPGRMGSLASGVDMTDQHPVTMVTWRDTVIWCNALSEMTGMEPVYIHKTTGAVLRDSTVAVEDVVESEAATHARKGYRLLSSMEYEFAARYRGDDSTNTVAGYTNPYFTKGNSASGATASTSNAAATDAVAWSYDNTSPPPPSGTRTTQPVKGLLPNALGLYDMSGNAFVWCFTESGSDRVYRSGSWNEYRTDMMLGFVDDWEAGGTAWNDTSLRIAMTASGTVYDSALSTTFTPPDGVTEVEVLVVAGGGGGGGVIGGGGGGGGVILETLAVTPGAGIAVTVGAGGAGGNGWNTATQDGKPGGNSLFGTLTALGGGGGAHHGGATSATVMNGGSGGGGAVPYSGNGGTGLQPASSSGGFGNDGGSGGDGNRGAGGGGAGSDGGDTVAGGGGDGGDGLDFSSVFGTSSGDSGWFGGGGGGGIRSDQAGNPGGGGNGGGGAGTKTSIKAGDGLANTGGGGGGAGYNGLSDAVLGGDGGSGIVIVRYVTSEVGVLTGYWKFNLDVEDSSGNDNHGTLSDPAPEYAASLNRDLAVYTDYMAITVVTHGPTVDPPPDPVTEQVTLSSGTWQVPDGVYSVEVLVVGGGGGGGGASISVYAGGGGGAGGVLYDSGHDVTPGESISVTVGSGGGGGSGGNARGSSGGNSVFDTITATGGGGGGSGGSTLGYRNGLSGGSGGGAGVQTSSGSGGSGTAGPPRQGYNGGNSYYYGWWIWNNAAGGGGGAGAVGANGGSKQGGAGGAGAYYGDEFGTGVGASGWFAGGGGGGAYNSGGSGGTGGGGGGSSGQGHGTPGTANTGGGGGGAASTGGSRTGGNGGSGVVIVKYTISHKTLTTSASTGGSVTPEPPGDNFYTNEEVSISASPDTCYTFVEWTGTGVDAGKVAAPDAASTTITMDDNYAIHAVFEIVTATYSLTLTADPPAGGAPSYAGTSPFSCGVNVSISANPNTDYVFDSWDPESGVASPNASDTTVQMTQARNLTAYYTHSSEVTPTPVPIYEGAISLTRYVAADDFRLTRSGNMITANMTAGLTTNMGKYIEKQLTIYLHLRPAYLLPEEDYWAGNTVSTIGSFTISGTHAVISGDVKVGGTVTVDPAADGNKIDGTLTCPEIIGDNQAKLSYNERITQDPNIIMPDLGNPQSYFATILTEGTQDWDEADVLREYVFTGDVSLTSVNQVWQDNNPATNQLKPGMYYSPGTITLADTYTRGEVTFIAERIIIENNSGTGGFDAKIMLGPYYEDLLFWANGSAGDPTIAGDGDILIKGTWDTHACATLEGVLYAPNGEIELAGSGRTGWFGFIAPAELYRGALVAQHLTISGNHWYIYRW